jgi:hypothetical protein
LTQNEELTPVGILVGHHQLFTHPGPNVIKLFWSVIYEFFKISQGVCQTRLEKLAKDKHSSLLQK